MDNPQDLVATVSAALQADNQYVEHVSPEDTERIADLRSAGRTAGRQLGWKVRTGQTDPDRRDDGKVVVWIVVTESTPLRDHLHEIRGQRRLRQALDRLFQPPANRRK